MSKTAVKEPTTTKDLASLLGEAKLQAQKDVAEARQASVKEAVDQMKEGRGVGKQKVVNGKIYNAAEYEALEEIGSFLKDMIGGNLKAQQIGTEADGGYLVPEIFEAQIVEKMRARSILVNMVDTHPQLTDTQHVNIDDGTMTAAITSEDVAITESKVAFRRVKLTAYFLAALGTITNRLLRFSQSSPAIADYVVNHMAQVISRTEDKYLTDGTGSSQPFGLSSLFKKTSPDITIRDATTKTTVNGGITWADLNKLIYAMQAEFANEPGLGWYCRRDLMPHLSGLNDGTSGSTLALRTRANNVTVPDGAAGLLMGIPIYNTTQLKNNYSLGTVADTKGGALVLMNPHLGLMRGGFGEGIRFATSEHSEFGKDNTQYRAVTPISSQVKLHEAILAIAYQAKA